MREEIIVEVQGFVVFLLVIEAVVINLLTDIIMVKTWEKIKNICTMIWVKKKQKVLTTELIPYFFHWKPIEI